MAPTAESGMGLMIYHLLIFLALLVHSEELEPLFADDRLNMTAAAMAFFGRVFILGLLVVLRVVRLANRLSLTVLMSPDHTKLRVSNVLDALSELRVGLEKRQSDIDGVVRRSAKLSLRAAASHIKTYKGRNKRQT